MSLINKYKNTMKKTVITARSNPWVQQWLRYHAKPTVRKAAGLVWLEGEHLAVEALQQLQSKRFTVLEFVVPNTAAAERVVNHLQLHIDNAELSLLLSNIKWIFLDEAIYKSLCALDSMPSVCTVLHLNAALDFKSISYRHTTVVLDSVQDPGNIGTIIRLCAAFDISQVILSAGCASAWGLKALRAGQGAQLTVNIYEMVDLNAIYPQFKSQRLPIFVTSLSKDSLPLNQIKLESKMVWVFGNEGQGVSKVSELLASQAVHIPMQGNFESLNVGSAAAICLWAWQNSLKA
jgi:RNA methyltransferase, TrmH family